jgi:protein SCO1/2
MSPRALQISGSTPRAATCRKAPFRLLRLAVGLAVAVVAGLLSAPHTQAASDGGAMKLSDFEVGNYAIGGDFTLTSQLGKPVSLHQFQGRVVVIFFGYIHCTDICPLTLVEMGKLKTALGENGAKMQPLFVSVDPERDTPRRLRVYLHNFSRDIVGLTGAAQDVQAVAKRYQAKFDRQPNKSGRGYSIAHTGFVYMLDPQQKVRYLFPYDAQASLLAEGVRHLLGG